MQPVYPEFKILDKYHNHVFYSCGMIYKRLEDGGLVSLTIFKSKKGYLMCRIAGKLFYVHRIIAEVFLKSFNKDLQVNHIDGNKLNNDVSNLEMCTNKENMKHALRNGLVNNRGSNNGMSKLTENNVIEIRNLIGKMKQKDIAKLYNIDQSVISDIKRKVLWRNI